MERSFKPSGILCDLSLCECCRPLVQRKIFKNYALKSMSDVNTKLDEAALYIERNRTLVKSIASFPYIAKSY